MRALGLRLAIASFLWSMVMVFSTVAAAASAPLPPLRVQLTWTHQAQFAGYYVADFLNYFRREGVAVQLLEGGHDIDPLERLNRGDVDVAVSWLDHAIAANAGGAHLINVAQVFAGSSHEFICRISAGIHSIEDLAGKTISVTWPGDQITLRSMLKVAGVDDSKITWAQRSEHGEELVSGAVPCISGMSYNEALWVVDAGVPASDLITFSSKDFGIPHLEDGLYVRAESLESEAFRQNLVKFLIAVHRGWAYAKAEPAPATNIVLRYADENSTSFRYQKAMLDNIVATIPTNTDNFGAIDIRAYDRTVRSLAMTHADELLATPIWTMSILEAAKTEMHGHKLLKESTRQYLRILMHSEWFRAFVFAGIWIFGFAGGLWATEAGYNLIGRIVISAVGCMGGGVLRDLLLGGDRLPFPWLTDPLLPLGVFGAVMAASLVVALLPAGTHGHGFVRVKAVAEDIGYASVATFGAVIPLSMELPWVWAPFCAWLTCCGGSLVRDVITGREPTSFRAKLYEECTLVGGVWIVVCLLLSNHFEHTRWLVTAALVTTILWVGGLRYYWRRHPVWYPRWLHYRQ